MDTNDLQQGTRPQQPLITANVATEMTESLETQNCVQPPEPPMAAGTIRRRERTFNRVELQQATTLAGLPLVLDGIEYDLRAITTQERLEDVQRDHPTYIPCILDVARVIAKLDVNELRDLSKIHNIEVSSMQVRPVLLDTLNSHICTERCERSIVLIEKCAAVKGLKNLIHIESQDFLDACKPFISEHVLRFVTVNLSKLIKTYSLVKVRINPPEQSNRNPSSQWGAAGVISVYNPPFEFLWNALTIKGLQALAFVHQIKIPDRTSKPRCLDLLRNHNCNRDCPIVAFDLLPHGRGFGGRAKYTSLGNFEGVPYVWPDFLARQPEPYPPPPINLRDIASVLRTFCAELTPAAVEEGPCSICAQLTKIKDLKPLRELKNLNMLDILDEPSASRAERKSVNSAVTNIPGPVLLLGSNSSMCPECHACLSRGSRPKLSLANHLWLGEVPPCLKDLTLAEQTLIARVRFNRCVVRVSNGHAKMVANVIAFEHPSMKIYEKLPIGRDELDDVLGVFFTGVSPPSDDDLKRTPVIVRREKVKNALEWLKLNHKNYQDLNIDYGTLQSYPLHDVPVQVVYVQTTADQGNVPEGAMSIFDNEAEIGTEEGPCSFSVHGLTSERFGSMTTAERKTAALQHLKNGGGFLAVGHDPMPQSLYHNESLYPQMFPHLFPYGYGGLGQNEHSMLLSKENHLRWMMGYHDKRFQLDATFVVVAFNHQSVKQSTSGSFMMIKRKNFLRIADGIRAINPAVLASIAERMKEGVRVVPQTPAEQACFSLLDQIEYVGGHVKGSMTSKKQQRNELWSLIAFTNTPQWFVTFSPCDNKHPICIYLSGSDVKFSPEIKSASVRELLVTRNPVACARFFHYMVELFIKHICGWESNENGRGVFGKPSAYFGTVEQQGRMTLHLHFLLWIDGAPSPQEIRDKLLSGDSKFEEQLIAYMESCQVGEFQTGTMEELKARIPKFNRKKDKGIHTLFDPEEDIDMCEIPENYIDPTLTLPEAPPHTWCERNDNCQCPSCIDLEMWYERFKGTFDDIVFRSNVHKCFGRKDNADSAIANKSTPRQHLTGKGCINKHGVCTARFPRTLFDATEVDRKTGHISLKKHEPMINNVTPTVSYAFRCNTDTTCLGSGTAVNSTAGYVTDYITKGTLKTHQIFSAMYNVFSNNSDVLSDDSQQLNGARKMILKVVNSLSAKMEIGAPMAALYLLQNPDYYTSHEFQPFYWKNFVNYVNNQWENLRDNAQPQDVDNNTRSPVGIDIVPPDAPEGTAADRYGAGDETVRMGRSGNNFISKASTDDYRYRPIEHEKINLYEWIQCSLRHHEGSGRNPRQDLPFFRYLPEHPMSDSHLVACDPERRYYVVPNFLGPALPRKDKGDREDYCMAMMTLFAPWRSGLDLKGSECTWQEAFDAHAFTTRQLQLMKNFNVRYECYDARDDFSAAFKKISAGEQSVVLSDDEGDGVYTCGGAMPEGDEDTNEQANLGGPDFRSLLLSNTKSKSILAAAGCTENFLNKPLDMDVLQTKLKLPTVAIDGSLTASAWRHIIRAEKERLFRAKFSALTAPSDNLIEGNLAQVKNDAYEVPASYLSKEFLPSNPQWITVMDDIVKEYSLNTGQERAFRIVANHATCIAPEQLLMHLGGMGGTGKSQVIKALVAFFERRKEPYRFVLLAPTGTAAALIGGTTYHSFLGFQTGRVGNNDSMLSTSDVIERMKGVGYVLMDEISMVSAINNCRISARCCEATGIYDKPYGGLNVIYAGDFAQLPPVRGLPLYSRSIALHQTRGQDLTDQENTIGKLIWLQFTTVVILTENMRQTNKSSPEEDAFRDALENLRYRACTATDIALINSRVATQNSMLNLDDEQWKYVSIITAKNREKDHYNIIKSLNFANETGQTLYSFYSIDTLGATVPERKRGKKTFKSCVHLTRNDQESLWNQPPHTSDQIPGCLKLCLGMPVLIRYNEATDLCMTRGQEARVVGWVPAPIPGFDGKQCLDVLFLQLTKPPKNIKLPHLPINVVPLTRMAQTVDAQLPSDLYLHVSRSQVAVLPNFAMTDYSAQGKTREQNVVDVTECKSFQGVYTCLSRGTSLQGTLVLRNFDSSLLNGPLDGALRQEYRELNYLDTITTLRYEGSLPDKITQKTRGTTIAAYRLWKKSNEEDSWHPKIRKEDASDVTPAVDIPIVRPLKQNSLKRKGEGGLQESSKKKRKTNGKRGVPVRHSWVAPSGPAWDGQDYSCAYDAWTTVLYSVWTNYGLSAKTGCASAAMSVLVKGFGEIETGSLDEGQILTRLRDEWRQALRETHPGEYPVGNEGADMITLSRHLLGTGLRLAGVTVACATCGRSQQRDDLRYNQLGIYNVVTERTSIVLEVKRRHDPVGPCSVECPGQLIEVHNLSDLMCFEVFGNQTTLDRAFDVEGGDHYRLAGVIYYGGFHFVSRVITKVGKIYTHDGIDGTSAVFDGVLDHHYHLDRLNQCNGRPASIAIYSRV